MESFRRYSAASKARWAKISPAERSIRSRKAAKAFWATQSPDQKKDRISAMVLARQNKLIDKQHNVKS